MNRPALVTGGASPLSMFGTLDLPSAGRADAFTVARARPSAHVAEILDRDRWNALVVRRPHYELEQGWEWGEVQREAGWIPHRYAAFRGGTCVGMLSVTRRWIPGAPYSVLYASRGPLVDWNDHDACESLFLAARRLAHRHQAIVLRVSPSVQHDDADAPAALARQGLRALPDDWTTWNAPRVTMSMDVDGDEDALMGRFRRRIRQNIRSAPSRGLRVRLSRDPRDLAGFQRLLVAMGREKRYPVRGLERLEALWQAYVVSGDGVLALVEHDGAPLAGLLGARLGRQASLLCAAVVRDRDNRPHGPSAYWAFIQWAKRGGCDSIDFGGSATHAEPRETDEGYGLYRFKAGFGSELRYWAPYHDLVFRPRLYALARAAERVVLPQAWRLRARLNR